MKLRIKLKFKQNIGLSVDIAIENEVTKNELEIK